MEFEGQLLAQNYRKVKRSQKYTKFEADFSIEKNFPHFFQNLLYKLP